MSVSNVKQKHIGHQIAEMMDRLGVSPLPRNYSLFYNCITVNDQTLRNAVRDLGNAPTQAELDGIIDEFTPEAFGSGLARRQQDQMIRNIDDVLTLLNVEVSELTSFTGAIRNVSDRLSKHLGSDKIAPEAIQQVASAIVENSQRKAAGGNRAIQGFESRKDEMGKLKAELEQLRVKANTDDLTKIANRRAFDEYLAVVSGKGLEFGLILLDIDHFKKINDTFGHPGGDQVLRVVADRMRKTLGTDAFLARTGGEEFGIVLRSRRTDGLTSDELLAVGERVRKEIEAIPGGVRVTVSVGASLSVNADSVEALYVQADQMLYRSKNAGRNQTTVYAAPVPESSQRYNIYKG